MVKRVLMFALFLLLIPGCYRKPDHVPFEPYKSPQELEQRLQALNPAIRKDPRNLNLQLDYAEMLIEKRKHNNIVDEFIELGL